MFGAFRCPDFVDWYGILKANNLGGESKGRATDRIQEAVSSRELLNTLAIPIVCEASGSNKRIKQ